MAEIFDLLHKSLGCGFYPFIIFVLLLISSTIISVMSFDVTGKKDKPDVTLNFDEISISFNKETRDENLTLSKKNIDESEIDNI